MVERNKYENGFRRYLEAETTLTEETDLQEHAAAGRSGGQADRRTDGNGSSKTDTQENDLMRKTVIAEKMIFSPVNDEDIMEFDRIISMAEGCGPAGASAPVRKGSHGKSRIKSMILWTGSIAAAAAVTLFAFLPSTKDAGVKEDCPFETIEIARNIQELMDLGLYEIESITARPERDRIILVATLSDGTEMTYLMTKDPADGSTRLTAMNGTINH